METLAWAHSAGRVNSACCQHKVPVCVFNGSAFLKFTHQEPHYQIDFCVNTCCFPLMLRNGHRVRDQMLCQDVGPAGPVGCPPTRKHLQKLSRLGWKGRHFSFYLEVFSVSPGYTHTHTYERERLDMRSKCTLWPGYWVSILLNRCRQRVIYNSLNIL